MAIQKPDNLTVDQAWDMYLRAAATIENMRKAHRLEIKSTKQEAEDKAMLKVLPIVDNVEKAFQQSTQYHGRGGAVDNLKDGISAVASHARGVLASIDINPFSCEREEFDPKRMDAISRAPTNELEPGRVYGDLECGYTIRDRVLRTAKVSVSVLLEENNNE